MKAGIRLRVFCLLLIGPVYSFLGSSSSFLCTPGGTSQRVSSDRKTTGALNYDSSSSDDDLQSCMDLPAIDNKTKEILLTWLCSLPKLERSENEWIGHDILTFSPSALLEEQLISLCPTTTQITTLFPTEASRAKFDFDWRCLLLKTIPSFDLNDILQDGLCNSHPMRLQLIAFPPNCELTLHVHAAVELAVPIIGQYCQRRTHILLPRDNLSRRPEHSIGTPLSNFSDRPTADELNIIREDLTKRAHFPNVGDEGKFESEKLSQGQCLLNKVGSVHQSFTSNEPCLLWVLGPSVQAQFLEGNFCQEKGIGELTDVYHNPES